MKKVILVRYSEIHLKGNNKHFFEKLLLNNIKIALKEINLKIEFAHTRYIISEFEESKIDEIISKLKNLLMFFIH